MPRTPDDPTKAQAWLTQNGPQVDLELYVPRGNKGDPGGIVMGTDLGAANLNDFKTSGVYRQPLSTNATALNNYPAMPVAAGGVLTVHQRDSGMAVVLQTYQPTSGAWDTRVMWSRMLVGGSWTTWRAYASQRVDQTAGRVIYTWDDLNQREQLVYGDTGWRDISALLINGWTATTPLLIRRVGSGVVLTGTLNGGARTSDHFVPMAGLAGFCPANNQPFGLASNVANETVKLLNNNSVNLYITAGAATSYSCYASYMTVQNWPTTLPGTPSGTIPNL